ncbi:hypothetical protein EI94DRAFT_1742885 [Lactarius quietus]|nr:hypothetical protein EI94DRAFT_1742885 [Lactarius quietus]
MPLNSIPPTTSVDNLEVKRHVTRSQCWTDVTFWGGVIPGNQGELVKLVDAGVKGFKCFMIESGVEVDFSGCAPCAQRAAVQEFPRVSESDLRPAMDTLKDTGSVLMFHAEVDNHSVSPNHEDPTQYRTFSRPESYEADAISCIANLQKEYPTLRCHIVHLSAIQSLMAAPSFKCCPPIRDDANREALWAALIDGTINCVVSDHSPCVAELKKLDDGDIMGAWGGISTLGLGLSLLWTEARKRNVPIGTVLQWTSLKTASHAGLADRKGKIELDTTPTWSFGIRMLNISSRKNRFGSKTNSRHMKAWCSPGEWSGPFFEVN